MLNPAAGTTFVRAAAVALGTTALAVALYNYRSLDDNRLTSWEWAFSIARPDHALLGLVLAAPAAWFLSGLRVRGGALAVFAFAFCAGAPFWAVPDVIVDAGRYFAQAKYFALNGPGAFFSEWGREVFAWTDMPLMSVLHGLMFMVFGESRAPVLIVNTALFAGSAALTALLGRELWDEETGLLGGTLLLAVPYLYAQLPLLMVDVPAMFFLALALYAYVIAVRRGGTGRVAFAALAAVAAAWVKFSLWPMLSVLGVALVVLAREGGEAVFRRGMAALALAAFMMGISLIGISDVVGTQMDLLREYQKPGLLRWGEGWASTFLYQTHPIVTLAAAYSLVPALLRRDARHLIASWLMILLVAVLHVKRSRYAIPALPGLALMAAYGVRSLGDVRLGRFIASYAVLGALVLGLIGFVPLLRAMELGNLRDAGRFLDELPGEAVRVVTLRQRGEVSPSIAVPMLDLYTDKRIVYEPKEPEEIKQIEPALTPDEIAVSPFRFTWELKPPAYYRQTVEGSPDLLAVIAPVEPGPPGEAYPLGGYRLLGSFQRASGLFAFRTFVYVYGRAEDSSHRLRSYSSPIPP